LWGGGGPGGPPPPRPPPADLMRVQRPPPFACPPDSSCHLYFWKSANWVAGLRLLDLAVPVERIRVERFGPTG
jgi:hypothetical protein